MRITKPWVLSVGVDYDTHVAIGTKIAHLGITHADFLRMAIAEYLERNPEQNEAEEAKKFPKRSGGLYD